MPRTPDCVQTRWRTPATQEIKQSEFTQTGDKSVNVDYYINPILHLAIKGVCLFFVSVCLFAYFTVLATVE